jgi:hypothetical protein
MLFHTTGSILDDTIDVGAVEDIITATENDLLVAETK